MLREVENAHDIIVPSDCRSLLRYGTLVSFFHWACATPTSGTAIVRTRSARMPWSKEHKQQRRSSIRSQHAAAFAGPAARAAAHQQASPAARLRRWHRECLAIAPHTFRGQHPAMQFAVANSEAEAAVAVVAPAKSTRSSTGYSTSMSH